MSFYTLSLIQIIAVGLLAMSAILKFITVMQKVLIIICVACFIPTSVFVFIPKPYTFSSSQLATYSTAFQQVFSSFILGYNGNGCTFREALLNNQYCFQRADAKGYRVNYAGGTSCSGFSYQYDGLEFCSGLTQQQGGTIYNSIQPSTNLLKHSNTSYPIFKVGPPFASPVITYFHYVPASSADNCVQLANFLSEKIQDKYSFYYYKSYEDSSRLLWYCCLPILAIMLITLVINEITNKFNLRKYILMACFATNVILIGLIVKVITYFTNIEIFQSQISAFSYCFAKEEKSAIAEMANFDFGVGFGLVFFMGIVALLIFLSMVGQLLAKLLQMKYYSSRDMPEETGVELSDLKTSLRSRRIKETSTPGQSRAKAVQAQNQYY